MEDKKRRPMHFSGAVLLFLPLFLPPAPVHAAEQGEYSFEILPDGTPLYTQVLRWDSDPNVLYYEVTLQTGAGGEISVTKLEKSTLPLNLAPGDYRYRIVIYNLLRKPEVVLPWQEFTVLKAEIPRITDHAPKVWFLEGLEPLLTISGTDLIPGATVTLSPAAGGEAPLKGTEMERDGTSTVSVAFPAGSVTAGVYSIELKNPGGLSAAVPDAILVRHMLPAPTGLTPSSGTTFGPSELRGMNSLPFAWDAVSEATQYAFCLYRGAETVPMVRLDPVTDLTYTLADLSVLDRGEYRWTVEALAKDGEKVVIPAAAAAESRFTIDLPPLVVPAMSAGDTFYGR